MESLLHNHHFIFNDDGFEVCDKCGICTTQRYAEQSSDNHLFVSQHVSEFSDILINNHIGYIEEIEKKYISLKKKLVRGYPNCALYAYCTYNTLLDNDVYYSIQHIAAMFKLKDFTKYFCRIEAKMMGEKKYFDISHERYIYSSLNIFLAQNNLSHYLKGCMTAVKLVKKQSVSFRPHILICLSLYLILKDVHDASLLSKLSSYYSVNIRTLKSFTKLFHVSHSRNNSVLTDTVKPYQDDIRF